MTKWIIRALHKDGSIHDGEIAGYCSAASALTAFTDSNELESEGWLNIDIDRVEDGEDKA